MGIATPAALTPASLSVTEVTKDLSAIDFDVVNVSATVSDLPAGHGMVLAHYNEAGTSQKKLSSGYIADGHFYEWVNPSRTIGEGGDAVTYDVLYRTITITVSYKTTGWDSTYDPSGTNTMTINDIVYSEDTIQGVLASKKIHIDIANNTGSTRARFFMGDDATSAADTANSLEVNATAGVSLNNLWTTSLTYTVYAFVYGGASSETQAETGSVSAQAKVTASII